MIGIHSSPLFPLNIPHRFYLGYLTATSSEDWTVVLDVCERASATEANAKEAAKALRREFKCVICPQFPSYPHNLILFSDMATPHNNYQRQECAFQRLSCRMRLTLSTKLWAIMLRNSSELYVHQCVKNKFLDTFDDVLPSQRTSPVVRERFLDVLAAAAYAGSGAPQKNETGFRLLWRKVKPAGEPDEVGPVVFTRLLCLFIRILTLI